MDAVTFQAEAMRYERLMYQVSHTMLRNRDDCADAVQETLVRAWQKRGSLRDESRFRTWIMRILVNTCNDMLRKRSRQQAVPFEEATMAADPPTTPSPLMEAIEQLRPEYRLVILLHYMEGYSVNEMSEVLNVPSGTVKSRMKHARVQLSKLLREPWEGLE